MTVSSRLHVVFTIGIFQLPWSLFSKVLSVIVYNLQQLNACIELRERRYISLLHWPFEQTSVWEKVLEKITNFRIQWFLSVNKSDRFLTPTFYNRTGHLPPLFRIPPWTLSAFFDLTHLAYKNRSKTLTVAHTWMPHDTHSTISIVSPHPSPFM